MVFAKYIWFHGSMGFLSTVSLIYSIIKKQQFKISKIDVLVILFIGSVFFTTCVFNYTSANQTKIVIMALLLVLYICLRLVINSNRKITYILCFLIIITGLVEAVWGSIQIYGFLPPQHSIFKLTGSFYNPGPYAGYLAVVLPLALYYWIGNDDPKVCIVGRLRLMPEIIIGIVKEWINEGV